MVKRSYKNLYNELYYIILYIMFSLFNVNEQVHHFNGNATVKYHANSLITNVVTSVTNQKMKMLQTLLRITTMKTNYL